MLAVSITGKARRDNPRKWDFTAHVLGAQGKIVSVVWHFVPQSKKPVHTKTLEAPGYVWTSDGEKTVTVVVVDSKGNKGSVISDIYVGKAPAPTPTPSPAPVPPSPTPTPAPSPAPTPSPGARVFPLPTSLVALEEGTYQVRNFNKGQNSTKVNASNYSFYTKGEGDIIGKGSIRTHIALLPHSSTKKSAVPVVKGNGGGLTNPTNNMYVGRVEGLSRHLAGFSIIGSDQGHMYNGLRVDHVSNLLMEDVAVLYIPGNASGNPGETFLINLQRIGKIATLKKVQLIGGNGALKSAAGLGLNSTSAKVVIEDLLTKDMQESAGIATWQQTGDIDISGWVHDGPARNFGAERLAANVRFNDPKNKQKRTVHGTHDATYTWGDHEAGDYKGGSLTWNFSSEAALNEYLIPGRTKIKVLTNSKSVKQGIKKSVRVTLAGRDRTSDLLVWAGA